MPIATLGKPGRIVKAGLTATLLLLLQACAARPPEPPAAAGEPAPPPPPAGEAPALDGRLLVDAQEYPWSAIGRLNLAGQGFCNGILIGAQQVLTQARCLYAAREGRWWRPQELHFIAAYQRDNFLADSKVADFTVAPGFNPAAGVSLANLTNNWAVVKLREPIGQKTGWLSINWDDANLGPESIFLRAGYRSDRPHAVNIHFGCTGQDGAVDLCAATPAERSLPSFVLVDGELRVVGEYYTRWASQSPYLLEAAQLQSGNRLAASRGPARGSLVGRQPTATVTLLLEALGYDVVGGDLAAAAAAFRRDKGLPPGGEADIALLTALVTSAQNGGGR